VYVVGISEVAMASKYYVYGTESLVNHPRRLGCCALFSAHAQVRLKPHGRWAVRVRIPVAVLAFHLQMRIFAAAKSAFGGRIGGRLSRKFAIAGAASACINAIQAERPAPAKLVDLQAERRRRRAA
jgi:hypothetical protein